MDETQTTESDIYLDGYKKSIENGFKETIMAGEILGRIRYVFSFQMDRLISLLTMHIYIFCGSFISIYINEKIYKAWFIKCNR